MKHKPFLFLFILLIIIIVSFFFIVPTFINKQIDPFYLEEEYYNSSSLEEIDIDSLKTMLDEKKNFAVFVYQPMCVTSQEFNDVLNEFQQKHQITFYKISFSTLTKANMADPIKYYPSFVIYKEGKPVDFLEADKEEDTKCYQDVEDFEDWFMQYVLLK